jgi:hypothetical protein
MLTQREVYILSFIDEYNRLTAIQLSSLLSRSLNRTQEHLTSLYKKKAVRRISFHPLHQIAGRASYVYTLSRSGQRLIKPDALPPSLPNISPLQIPHVLAVNDFRISLKKACQDHDALRLVGEIPEYRDTDVNTTPSTTLSPGRSRAGLSSQGQIFVPDLTFVLQRQDNQALLFAEIDRSTESVSVIEKKIHLYQRYATTQGWTRYQDHFSYPFRGFRLLFVAQAPRIRRILGLCTTCGFVFLADMDAIKQQGPLAQIWQCPVKDLGKSYTFWEA